MKIAIVGGGLAGIAAAHTLLADRRVTYLHMIEASDRYGGRAYTDRTSIKGYAFDQGAQQILSPASNPLTDIARRLGFDTMEARPRHVLRVRIGEQWQNLPVADADVQDVIHAIASSFNENSQYADRPVAAPRPITTQSALFGQALSAYGPFSATAEPWQYLAGDRARKLDPVDSPPLYVLRGVGSLVTAYGMQLKQIGESRYFEHFDARVGRIHVADRHVNLEFNRQNLNVDACILTVPVSMLTESEIKFEPALPAAHRNAIQALRLGAHKKLALRMRSAPAELIAGTDYYLIDQEYQGVWRYCRLPYAPDVLLADAAGDFAAFLDCLPESEVLDMFMTSVRAAHPSVLFSPHRQASNWRSQRHIQGACSYTAIDRIHPASLAARDTLRTPIQTLYLAGEATSTEHYGTLQGAYFEGVGAANAILATLAPRAHLHDMAQHAKPRLLAGKQ